MTRRGRLPGRLLLLAVPAAAGVAIAPAQEPVEGATREEGRLDNRTILPSAPDDVERRLVEGDAALAAGRPGAAFQAWGEAIGRSDANTGFVRVDERTFVGVREAVRRRVASLSPEDLGHWRSRIETLADGELGAAGADDALRRLVRSRPATRAAARAAIRLGDGAIERGEPSLAQAYFREAFAADAPALRADAYARRAAAALLLEDREEFERLRGEAAGLPPIHAGGTTAPAAEWIASIAAALPAPPGPGGPRLAPVGAPARLDEESSSPRFDPVPAIVGGHAFVQTPRHLYRFELESPRRLSKVDLDDLLGAGWAGEPTTLVPILDEPPPRSFLRTRPSGGDRRLALVHGSPSAERGNVLALFEASPALDRGALPRLLWSRRSAEVVRDGETASAPAHRLDGLAFVEPALLRGERIYCGLARAAGETSSYLGCFDARSGRLEFLRLLATGSEVDREGTRRALESRFREGAEALPFQGGGPVASGGVVFYETGLGASAAVDAGTGELLFGFKTARRPPIVTDAGPRPTHPAAWSPHASPKGFAVAPADSLFLYAFAFPAATGAPRASLLLHPPIPVRDAIFDAAWQGPIHYFLAASGREGTAVAIDADSPSRADSAPLAPDERFAAAGDPLPRLPAFASDRMFVATDRYLYTLDPARDLYMEFALAPPVEPGSGLQPDDRDWLGNLVAVPGGLLSASARAIVAYRARGD